MSDYSIYRDKAVSLLQRDEITHVDMLQAFVRGNARLLYAKESAEGDYAVLLYHKKCDILMLTATSEELARDAFSVLEGCTDEDLTGGEYPVYCGGRVFACVTHNEPAAAVTEELFKLHCDGACRQCVYTGMKIPVPSDRFTVRQLTADDADVVK